MEETEPIANKKSRIVSVILFCSIVFATVGKKVMLIIKNIQFTRLFKVGGYLKEFNFRKSNPNIKGKFSVDTIDERGSRIMFFMEKTDSGWRILPQELPKWILDQENSFDMAIQEEFPG
jgi:hypothetical protein